MRNAVLAKPNTEPMPVKRCHTPIAARRALGGTIDTVDAN